MINCKNIIIALSVLLFFSLVANYFFYSKLNEGNTELDKSKGHVEILSKEVIKKTIEIDSLKKILAADIILIGQSKEKVVYITKSYANEKNIVRHLLPDSAIRYFAKRLSH